MTDLEELNYLDDRPISEFDWRLVQAKPEPNCDRMTPGEVAWCGVIGVILFGLGFAIMAALFIWAN